VRALARLSFLSLQTVQDELAKLTAADLIISRSNGYQRFYRANENTPPSHVAKDGGRRSVAPQTDHAQKPNEESPIPLSDEILRCTANSPWIDPKRSYQERGLNPACPASLGTLKVSVPPAVKLSAATHAQPALDPDIIAAVIGRLRRVTGLAAEAAILLKAEDFVLVICDMIIAS